MKLAELLPSLSGVRKGGQGFVAKCPAHDDRDPSLSLCEGDGRILMKCFAGCKTETIVRKLGLNWKDLFDKTITKPGNSTLGTSRTPAMHRSMDGVRYYGSSPAILRSASPWALSDWRIPDADKVNQQRIDSGQDVRASTALDGNLANNASV